jgi:antitoxin PrlF
MAIAHSRVTAQGQISVPAEVRKKLGVGPGSVIEWDQVGRRIVVRRVGQHTFEEMHESLFPKPPRPRTLRELKDGIRRHVRRHHPRR